MTEEKKSEDEEKIEEIESIEFMMDQMISEGTVEEVEPDSFQLTPKGLADAKELMKTESGQAMICAIELNFAFTELRENQNIWLFLDRIFKDIENPDFWMMKGILLHLGSSYKDRKKWLGMDHWKILMNDVSTDDEAR
jgi:hypothetical protein